MTDHIIYLTLAALAVAGLAILIHQAWIAWDRKRELRKMERIGERISGTRMQTMSGGVDVHAAKPSLTEGLAVACSNRPAHPTTEAAATLARALDAETDERLKHDGACTAAHCDRIEFHNPCLYRSARAAHLAAKRDARLTPLQRRKLGMKG